MIPGIATEGAVSILPTTLLCCCVIRTHPVELHQTRTFWRTLYQLSYSTAVNVPALAHNRLKNVAAFDSNQSHQFNLECVKSEEAICLIVFSTSKKNSSNFFIGFISASMFRARTGMVLYPSTLDPTMAGIWSIQRRRQQRPRQRRKTNRPKIPQTKVSCRSNSRKRKKAGTLRNVRSVVENKFQRNCACPWTNWSNWDLINRMEE